MKRRLTLVTAEETIPGDDDKNIPIIRADDDITDLLDDQDESGNITPGGSIMTFEEMEALYNPQLVGQQQQQQSEISTPTKNNDIEDEEELISEESDIEYTEDEESSEEDISDVDDTDLLKRLDAKYGKLPSKATGGNIDDDDDYENDDEADDIDPTWTSK